MSESKLRAVLPLLKGRVVDRGDYGFKIALGGTTTITVKLPQPHMYDVKDGDMLTLYTEVLFAKPQG